MGVINAIEWQDNAFWLLDCRHVLQGSVHRTCQAKYTRKGLLNICMALSLLTLQCCCMYVYVCQRDVDISAAWRVTAFSRRVGLMQQTTTVQLGHNIAKAA